MTRSTLVVPAALLASSLSVIALAQGVKPRPQDTDWAAPAQEKVRTSPVAKSPEGLERGRKLYLKHCSDCHGQKGKGDGPLSRLHAQRLCARPTTSPTRRSSPSSATERSSGR